MSARSTAGAAMLAATVAFVSCTNPSELPSADRVGAPTAATVSGKVVLQTQSRGNLLLFLFEASNPPPPVGSGHPIAFSQLPASTVFGSDLHNATGSGPYAADYTFPLVVPGTYLIGAQLDFDACLLAPSSTCQLADFDPFFDVTDQPNDGDLIGGHVDANQRLSPVVVPPGTTAGVGVDVSNVAVVVAPTPMHDRPAFQVSAMQAAIDLTQPATFFALEARPVITGAVLEANPAFLVRYRDENCDGIPDVDGHGLPQLWPKVFIRKVADVDPKHPSGIDPLITAGLRDENDLANTGQLDPTGIAYSAAPSLPTPTAGSATPSLVLIEAAITDPPLPDGGGIAFPLSIFEQLTLADGGPNMAAVLPMTTLPMVLFPVALDARNPVNPSTLAGVPPGRYAVIVEQFTGQTWRLPNELEPGIAAELGATALADQGWVFTVVP